MFCQSRLNYETYVLKKGNLQSGYPGSDNRFHGIWRNRSAPTDVEDKPQTIDDSMEPTISMIENL